MPDKAGDVSEKKVKCMSSWSSAYSSVVPGRMEGKSPLFPQEKHPKCLYASCEHSCKGVQGALKPSVPSCDLRLRTLPLDQCLPNVFIKNDQGHASLIYQKRTVPQRGAGRQMLPRTPGDWHLSGIVTKVELRLQHTGLPQADTPDYRTVNQSPLEPGTRWGSQ